MRRVGRRIGGRVGRRHGRVGGRIGRRVGCRRRLGRDRHRNDDQEGQQDGAVHVIVADQRYDHQREGDQVAHHHADDRRGCGQQGVLGVHFPMVVPQVEQPCALQAVA